MKTNAYRLSTTARRKLLGARPRALPAHLLAEVERQRRRFVERHGSDGTTPPHTTSFCSKTQAKR